MAKVGGYTELSTVAKALDILDMLSLQKQPVGTQAIADEMDITYTSAKNYLVTMESRKYVRSVGGQWELGQAVTMLYARRKAKLQAAQTNINQELGND
ncbi:MAG: helix-turn-helix domain-containing protein [Deferribacterales bacterium]